MRPDDIPDSMTQAYIDAWQDVQARPHQPGDSVRAGLAAALGAAPSPTRDADPLELIAYWSRRALDSTEALTASESMDHDYSMDMLVEAIGAWLPGSTG